jgi:hypothetical protein
MGLGREHSKRHGDPESLTWIERFVLLFRQQVRRRRRPFRDRPPWSEMAVVGVTLVGMQGFRCIGRRQATAFR